MSRETFAQLHVPGAPLVLYNVWDAGSALAAVAAGAKAVATGSHSLAGAQGYADGENIPFAQMLVTVRQIAGAIEVPLTVDFESGFAGNIQGVAENAAGLVDAGAVGCNLEDRLIGGDGLRAVGEQCERIAAVDRAGLFVNARTDVFLTAMKAGANANTCELVDAALDRARAYSDAGAGSFFVPGLTDTELIARVCEEANLPVNVMRLGGMPANTTLAELGVARISYGGEPWRLAMASVEEAARAAFAS